MSDLSHRHYHDHKHLSVTNYKCQTVLKYIFTIFLILNVYVDASDVHGNELYFFDIFYSKVMHK